MLEQTSEKVFNRFINSITTVEEQHKNSVKYYVCDKLVAIKENDDNVNVVYWSAPSLRKHKQY